MNLQVEKIQLVERRIGMRFDFSKLRGKIKEMYGTETAFTKCVGISKSALSKKLNNKSSFYSPEIYNIIVKLKLSINDIPIYFFSVKS